MVCPQPLTPYAAYVHSADVGILLRSDFNICIIIYDADPKYIQDRQSFTIKQQRISSLTPAVIETFSKRIVQCDADRMNTSVFQRPNLQARTYLLT